MTKTERLNKQAIEISKLLNGEACLTDFPEPVAARKSDNEVLDKAMKYRAEIDEEFILNEHYVEGRQDGFFDGYQQAEKDLGVEKK